MSWCFARIAILIPLNDSKGQRESIKCTQSASSCQGTIVCVEKYLMPRISLFDLSKGAKFFNLANPRLQRKTHKKCVELMALFFKKETYGQHKVAQKHQQKMCWEICHRKNLLCGDHGQKVWDHKI